MERIDKHFHKLAAPSFAKHGFAYGEVLARWAEIVGPEIADVCRPSRIKWPRGGGDDDRKMGGTLLVSAEPGRALEIQYKAPAIIERLNQFYGYAAICQVNVTQAPLPRSKSLNSKKKILTDWERADISAHVSAISDEGLRAALQRLGEGVFASRPTSPQGK